MTNLALATFGRGWHLEAALAALRLVVRGVFDRHPALQLVLGHWGALLREVTTPDRLPFSTDYPFQRPSRADIDRFGTAFPTDEDRERFMAGNARALFAIPS